MAINNYNVAYAIERDVISLFGFLTIGASGAVASVKGGGIKSITKKTGDGEYEIELEETIQYFLGGNSFTVSDNSTGSGVARIETHMDPTTVQSVIKSTKKFIVQCYDFTGAKVNPVSGSVVGLQIHVRRTSVSIGQD